MTHDPLCSHKDVPALPCDCVLINLVRASEQERAGERVMALPRIPATDSADDTVYLYDALAAARGDA